ncbi:hypothetical protein SERLADRAFT_460554 [Serpula lacrymans var. lacrymans S7.9]|uniref:Alpha-type protein kinase domain-containing protein n=1 Tax=Serpula lacrymans var. lacrymans (strain S7.9) TaxID=578457 RepID=F8NM84_SERL9|nr:uncharacterized protein SERLADRAFT_460554 [Serpula lacrymans var. lacrymans S7.9]EGO27334.1 hypothetical protein SERLADRAFT_460554 [Serpula lacrymans var. lacrymans S7.9]
MTLAVDTNSKSMVAPAGTFKMCHPAWFERNDDSSMSTESSAITKVVNVVAKRWFYRDPVDAADTGAGRGRKRLTTKDELAKMLDEANCLYWGTSLMNLAYDAVDEFISQSGGHCTIHIPQLCVVHAGLAVPQDARHGRSAVYLLEEIIEGKFIKYVNNNSATPRNGLGRAEHDIALFLCFAQHLQYWLSRGLVFLSDFQGAGTLLTECQVITTMCLGCFLPGGYHIDLLSLLGNMHHKLSKISPNSILVMIFVSTLACQY